MIRWFLFSSRVKENKICFLIHGVYSVSHLTTILISFIIVTVTTYLQL